MSIEESCKKTESMLQGMLKTLQLSVQSVCFWPISVISLQSPRNAMLHPSEWMYPGIFSY